MSDDPALEALMADLQDVNSSTPLKLAQDIGAPTVGIEASDYMANLIDEEAQMLKQANDLREGIIDEATLKIAKEECPDDNDKGDKGGKADSSKENKAQVEAGESPAKKNDGDTKDEYAKMKEALEQPWGVPDLPGAMDLDFFTQTGPKEVTAAFSEAFMGVLNERAGEFGDAFDSLLETVL